MLKSYSIAESKPNSCLKISIPEKNASKRACFETRKPQEQLFTKDRPTAASNKKQVTNYDIVKSPLGKISFKWSMCVIILYGSFSLIFILFISIFSYLYSLLVPQLFPLIPQTLVIGAQTLIYVKLCPVR